MNRPYTKAHTCRCSERMGNDFWFLPTGYCLFYDECPVKDEPPPARDLNKYVGEGEP